MTATYGRVRRISSGCLISLFDLPLVLALCYVLISLTKVVLLYCPVVLQLQRIGCMGKRLWFISFVRCFWAEANVPEVKLRWWLWLQKLLNASVFTGWTNCLNSECPQRRYSFRISGQSERIYSTVDSSRSLLLSFAQCPSGINAGMVVDMGMFRILGNSKRDS